MILYNHYTIGLLAKDGLNLLFFMLDLDLVFEPVKLSHLQDVVEIADGNHDNSKDAYVRYPILDECQVVARVCMHTLCSNINGCVAECNKHGRREE